LGSSQGYSRKKIELEELEELVRDAVHTIPGDLVLASLAELALEEVCGQRDVLGLPLIDVPLFWRRNILRWVRDVIEEDAALNRIRSGDDE
jgi:hypothetical protein